MFYEFRYFKDTKDFVMTIYPAARNMEDARGSAKTRNPQSIINPGLSVIWGLMRLYRAIPVSPLDGWALNSYVLKEVFG